MRFMKDCSSAPMQPLWRWERATTETENSLASSICQISILTILFHQKQS